MLCYRDKTFCTFDKCAQFGTCVDALSDEVKADAVKWWGNDNAPIATYVDEPLCFEPKSI